MKQGDRFHTMSWEGQPEEKRSGSKRAETAKKTARGKKQRKSFFVRFLIWAVCVVSVSFLLAGIGWKLANDMCAFNKPYVEATVVVDESWNTVEKKVTQEDGSVTAVTQCDMKLVANALHEKGLIEYPWFFRLFAALYNASEKVGQGTYVLNSDMDYMALIRGLRPGASGSKAVTVDVSIPEGYSVAQIIQLLADNGVATVEALTDAAANYVFDSYGFVDNEHLGDIRRLEGYLYPDTYNFYVGGKASTALNSMLKNFNKKVYADDEISALLEESAYSMEEIIIIASLIEKETDGTDRDKIASVIYNRLENVGETAHLLQIDAALVYAVNRAITQDDYTMIDSPYNLYQNTGLPPTPIANPGSASIRAALQPADTEYYFYVLGEDGKHIFSKTLAEHQQVISSLG